jgi:hypothetical protein
VSDLPDPAARPGPADRYAEAYGDGDTAGYADPDAYAVPDRPRSMAGPLALAGVVLVGVLGAGVWFVGNLRGQEDGRPVAYPTISQPSGVSATSTATARAAGPFEGTPAATFPEAADGLTMPTATAVKGWSAKQVGTHLAQVKKALEIMLLDERALIRHDPAEVLRMFAPADRSWIEESYTKPAEGVLGPLISGTARLSQHEPRIKGRTTVRGITDDGLHPLEIITNYVVVYPFDVQDLGPESRTAVFHVDIVWRIYPEDEVYERDQGLTIEEANNYMYGMDCAEADRGFLAPSPPLDGPGGLAGPHDDPDSFYDPERSLEVGDGCGSAPGSAPTTTT